MKWKSSRASLGLSSRYVRCDPVWSPNCLTWSLVIITLFLRDKHSTHPKSPFFSLSSWTSPLVPLLADIRKYGMRRYQTLAGTARRLMAEAGHGLVRCTAQACSQAWVTRTPMCSHSAGASRCISSLDTALSLPTGRTDIRVSTALLPTHRGSTSTRNRTGWLKNDLVCICSSTGPCGSHLSLSATHRHGMIPRSKSYRCFSAIQLSIARV